ncbi:TBC1 domain family member 15 [Teleopsis dalmanni]|uniref:TBC1 domain family member 15 n=1 Tax=Teleopsis dalmanni TaxID=139649 RepID=UPI0018CEC265|nr:TBC1 domain family member 15 [Teleopsis dalmanni]
MLPSPSESSQVSTSTESETENVLSEEQLGPATILCTHDGVLLKKTSAEHIAELNSSGALSLVEYTNPRVLFIEWRPNENILIADDSQDQGEWALVDTISRRTRTTSECKVFNTKPIDLNNPASKPRLIRTNLEELKSIEVKRRGHSVRLMRQSDGTVHTEYFFQHGNADLFVRSMRQLHIIDVAPNSRNGEEYIILTTEKQKLKKTFAELDIGEIKASSAGNESWLPNKVVGFLINIPDFVPPPFHRSSPKSRPGSLDDGDRSKLSTSTENYQMIGLSGSNTASSGSPSGNVSTEKSPVDSELENGKEQDEKIVNTLPERQTVTRSAPLNETQWLEFRTHEGRISDPTRIKEIIFRGGIEKNLRAEVWKYLLNYFKWDDTDVQRIQRRKEKSMEYYSMKAQWLSITSTQEINFSGYRDRKCQIEKDVKRTDRTLEFFAGEDNPNLMLLQGILMTYVMYNFDLGYVQGMSDLLAPILAIQENEVDAFWCFVGFMDMVFANFDIDQAGMKTQFSQLRRLLEFANPRLFNYMITHDSDNMYFCFRWLLVWYKREFSNDDVLKLWECLWTRLPCPNFHILVSVAILDQETDIIIENNYEFTEILKHVNELSGNIDVKRTLENAEAIYLQIKSADYLPNDIRQIINEPLLEPLNGNDGLSTDEQEDFEDAFDELVHELSDEEKRRQQELLEEACERSMFLQFM